ncbi:MAG: RAMP superfamily CRISPR-associated protein, partial [Cetobacterium sp.]
KKEAFIPGSTLKGMLKDIYYTIWYDYYNLEEEKFLEIEGMNYNNDDKVYDYEDYMQEILNEFGEDEFLENSLKISKLFGAKGLKSRIYISDAYFEGEGKIEKEKPKSITPIDRFTGGAVVPLQFEYTMDNFKTELVIKNFDIDELKALLFAIRDSHEGELRIGSSKTRGFGEIKLEITEVEYKEFKNKELIDTSEFKLDEHKSFKIGDSYLYKVFKLNKDVETNFEILKNIVG